MTGRRDPDDDDPLAPARGCAVAFLLVGLLIVVIVMGFKIVSVWELTVNSQFPM